MSIHLHIMDRGGALASRRAEIEAAAQAAIDVYRTGTDLSEVDISLVPTDWGTDQPFCTAAATGPHGVQITIEASRLDRYAISTSFFRTMVHELRHCLRWRHVTTWTVNEGLVLEGLALRADTLASRDTTSHIAPPDAPRVEELYVVRYGDAPLRKHRDWLYSSDDGTQDKPARIYSVGDYLMTRALETLGTDPFAAAALPAPDLIAAALQSPP